MLNTQFSLNCLVCLFACLLNSYHEKETAVLRDKSNHRRNSPEEANHTRHIKNFLGKERWEQILQEERLPVLVASHSSNMIKPGESFSFWRYVGKTSK